MGSSVGLLRGLTSSLSDTLLETAGFLIVRLTRPHDAGETDLYVDGLHRWPGSGRVAIDNHVYTYTSITVTTTDNIIHGIEEWKPYPAVLTVGLVEFAREASPVTYFGRDFSDLDLMRQGFFVETAEGTDLDTLARNFGLWRPLGMVDEMFRGLLMVMIYLDASTMYSVEKVLDVLVGAGNYDVWDTPLDADDHHKVFVELDPAPSTAWRGKTWMCGGELQTSTSPFTADTTYDPRVVYGVYERTTGDSSQDRRGDNFLDVTFNGFLNALQPTYLLTSLPTFQPTDQGRSVVLDDLSGVKQVWQIATVLSSITAELYIPDNVATISTGTPQTLTGESPVFRKWMVGHSIQVTDALDSDNLQTATIDTFVTEYQVTLSAMSGGGWASSQSGITFSINPNFSSVAFVMFDLQRYTLVGNTITTDPLAGALPANLWIDYATVPSAQLVRKWSVSGNDQYPFYLFNDTWWVSSILDLILAAGCHPVVTRTYE